MATPVLQELESFASRRGGYFVPAGRKQVAKMYLPRAPWLLQFRPTAWTGLEVTAVFINKLGFHFTVRRMGFLEALSQHFLYGIMPREETSGIILSEQFALECTHEEIGRELLENPNLLERIHQYKLELTPAPAQSISEIQYTCDIFTPNQASELQPVSDTIYDYLQALHQLGVAYPV
jgi:hypothetical protein